MSWHQRLECILEQKGAKKAIELGAQKELRRKASMEPEGGGMVDVLGHRGQEDMLHTKVRQTSLLRHVFSDKLEDGGGYGSCSPVLLFKVFFSAMQVLQLARRFDFEWPGYLREIFEMQASATGGNTFTVDCFFPGITGKVYERAFLVVVVPCLLVVIASAVFYLSLIHISEPTRLLSISYAVFCLKKKKKKTQLHS
eukprot:TRINITY_DN25309_c0_g3_i1.p1 TRINITY_DN25309_c0_g3~~TRINITY_DN25309_c0_g3_i1.p1  ORF type:complete len:197 (-),score=73.43 TRINITY_DN25309_c0_g3_i1:50-640(-)